MEDLAEKDRKTSNECFMLLGTLLCLQVSEMEGVCYSPLESTAKVFGFELLEFKWLLDECPIICKEADGHFFVPYQGVLLGGMMGETEAAQKVMKYILATEKTQRIKAAISH